MWKTIVSWICLGFLGWFPGMLFGQGPAMGTHRVMAPAVVKNGVLSRDTKTVSAPMLTSGSLASTCRGDWKTEAFWQGPPPDASAVQLDALGGWDFLDRVGDARRKLDRWLIAWGYGSDTYIYIRFDMNRVVTSEILPTSNNGYLSSDLYGRMRSTTNGPIISSKAMMNMFFSFALGDDGNCARGTPFNFSIVQFNDFVVSGYEQNTAYLGDCKPIKLQFPTDQLRYPTMPETDMPTPAWNMIVLRTNLTSLQDPVTHNVLIDGHSVNFLFDGELSYQAVAPIVFVHGMGNQGKDWANPATLNPLGQQWYGLPGNMYFNIVDFLNSEYLGPRSTDINLGRNWKKDGVQSILLDARELEIQLPDILDKIGARECHIVAHSKGGLDVREFLDSSGYIDGMQKERKMNVISLYTIATPHKGSILADIAYTGAVGSPDPDITDLLNYSPYLKTLLAPRSDAVKDMQTFEMAKFNNKHRKPNVKNFYNFTVDADWNDDGCIGGATGFEFEPYGQVEAVNGQAILGTAQYKILRNAKQINLSFGYMTDGITWRVLSVSQNNTQPQPNDLLVTYESALLDAGKMPLPLHKANHGTAKSKIIGQSIVKQILIDTTLE